MTPAATGHANGASMLAPFRIFEARAAGSPE